jgi:hypothetical protein
VVALKVEGGKLVLLESLRAVDEVGAGWVLGDEGALLQAGDMLGELLPACLLLDILHQTSTRNAFERVANPIREVIVQVSGS